MNYCITLNQPHKHNMEKSKTVFERLSAINVNEHVEKKDNLSYLSWAWAWSEVKKACPDATYKIGETEYDDALGFMCHTSVTINGETLEMWLPVMDGKNKSMKKYAYEYDTKWGKKTVEAATTFDINKTMMRCLVKNLAMFGLGIYIYAGEDLPEVEASATPVKAIPTKTTTKSAPKKLEELNESHKNWEIVKKALADGKTSMERLKGLYIISDDIEAKLK